MKHPASIQYQYLFENSRYFFNLFLNCFNMLLCLLMRYGGFTCLVNLYYLMLDVSFFLSKLDF